MTRLTPPSCLRLRRPLVLAALVLFGAAPALADAGPDFRAKIKASLWGVAVADEEVVAVGLAGQQVVVKDGAAKVQTALAGKPLLLSVAVGEAGQIAVGGEGFKAGAGLIYRSDDGGRGFVRIATGPAPLYEVAFPTPRLGYAVGAKGTMLRSDDGGATWVELETGSEANLWAVHFMSPTAGVIAGGDTPWQNDGRTSGESAARAMAAGPGGSCIARTPGSAISPSSTRPPDLPPGSAVRCWAPPMAARPGPWLARHP